MRFTVFTASFLAALSVSLAPTPVDGGLIAYSGSACDGSAGGDAPCDGKCVSFDGRHSFRVDGGNGNHCVTLYTDLDCLSGGQEFVFQNQDGQCTGVNTGAPARSFRCSANNICVA